MFLEGFDGLIPAIFKQREIGSGEIVDGVMPGIGHHDIHDHEVRVGADAGNWLRCGGLSGRKRLCAEQGCKAGTKNYVSHQRESFFVNRE
jgi:hypothetical protein